MLASFAALLSATGFSQSVTFDYSSLGSAIISFNGTASTFSFVPDTSGFDFQITDANPVGLDTLTGAITGTFAIGAISTFTYVDPITHQTVTEEEAPVTGTGTLSISDGSPYLFSATITSNSYTAFTVGTSGVLNPLGSVNLTDFSYSGSNLALEALASTGSGIDAVTFQFVPAETLTQLATGGTVDTTTFSGSFASVPEPAAYAAILGSVALGCAFLHRRNPALVRVDFRRKYPGA